MGMFWVRVTLSIPPIIAPLCEGGRDASVLVVLEDAVQ